MLMALLYIGAKAQGLTNTNENTNKLTITIVDQSSLQPIVGAKLTYLAVGRNNSPRIAKTVFTNAKGEAYITDIINAADTVIVSALGYTTYKALFGIIFRNNNKVFLAIKAYNLGDVIISASKFEEKSEDVAQRVQVINANTIAFQSQQTTADVLAQSGNVLVQKSQQGGGSPSIRGFEASRVLIVVDGVRMNNAIFRAGHLQNVIRIDNAMLDRAEIVFGPGSVVYGSDALGGVMHFYTRNPILSTTKKPIVQGGFYTRYASANNERTQHADISIGLKKWGFTTGITYSKFGNLSQGAQGYDSLTSVWKRTVYADRINGVDVAVQNADPNKQIGTDYSQYDILQKILFRPNENFQHTLNFQFSNTSNVPRYDRLTDLNGSGVPKSAEWYYGPEQRMLISYKLDIFKANKAFDKGNIILAFQDIKESRHSRNFGAANRTDRNEGVKVYSLNLDYTKKLGTSNELR